jgi:IclR family acetate operon transcriptional repressor
MEKLTANTITELDHLKKELELTRRRGWAIDDQERTPGIICIAAPIRDFSTHTVAALSISGPIFRIDRRRTRELTAIVRAAAGRASERLGFRDQLQEPSSRRTSRRS